MNIFILPKHFQKESQILFIKHPRTNLSSPFLISENKIFELLEVDRNPSSFLFAKQVISNGKLYMTVEFHPLFFALPLILERKSEFYSLDGFFDDTDIKPIESFIKPYFYLVCQQSKISGYAVWSYDENKMLDWLCNKISKLILCIKGLKQNKQKEVNVDSNVSENEFIESAFDILRHYIKASIAQTLKGELQNRYPGSFQSTKSSQLKQLQKKSIEAQISEKSIVSSVSKISTDENLIIKAKTKIDQSKKGSIKSTEAKKKKKDIKITKHPIESFFAPQKKK